MEADYRKYPQSIRALQNAGSSKLIAYRITQPRVFYRLALSGSECEPQIASLEWKNCDVAPRTQRYVRAERLGIFAATCHIPVTATTDFVATDILNGCSCAYPRATRSETRPIRIIPHRGVDDDCGSLEAWFADGRKSVRFYWDNLVSRWLGGNTLTREQAIEKATTDVGRAASFLSASSSADPRIVSCVADSAGYVVD